MKKETFKDFYFNRVFLYVKVFGIWTFLLFAFSYLNPEKTTDRDPLTIFGLIGMIIGLVWFLLIGGLLILWFFYKDFKRNISKYDLDKTD